MFIFDAALQFFILVMKVMRNAHFFTRCLQIFESGHNFLSFLLCFNIIMLGFVKSHEQDATKVCKYSLLYLLSTFDPNFH